MPNRRPRPRKRARHAPIKRPKLQTMRRSAASLRGLHDLCDWALKFVPGRLSRCCEVGTYGGEAASVFARYFWRIDCVDVPENPARAVWVERNRASGVCVLSYWDQGRGAAESFRDAGFEFDLIYIDAQHDYANVANDLAAWSPLVRAGGVLAGHDFQPKFPGVVRAVHEFCDAHELPAPERFCDTSWALRFPPND